MRGNDLGQTSEVAIVGGGPVGMLLALFLDRHGVKSVVFNTEERTRTHPKGSSYSARTMEHCRRLGISGTMRTLGLPADHPKDAAYFTRLSGWEIARYRMPSEVEIGTFGAACRRSIQMPEPGTRANQMYVEDFLLKHLRTRLQHRIALRLASRPVQPGRRTAFRLTRRASPTARPSIGRRATWSAAMAATAPCAVRLASAIPVTTASSKLIWAAV